MNSKYVNLLFFVSIILIGIGCTEKKSTPPSLSFAAIDPQEDPFLDSLSRETFNFFWDLAEPSNGNQPDRWPTPAFSSIAATGFGLTSYLVGVERGYITRRQAAERVATTLKFFKNASQGNAATGVTGY